MAAEPAAPDGGPPGKDPEGKDPDGPSPQEQAADRRRAVRLLRWYPAGWRARYGAEFAELLVADLADRPRSWRRAGDVIVSGLLARLTSVGLAGPVADPSGQVRAGLATLGCALAAFLTFGLAMLRPGNRQLTLTLTLTQPAAGSRWRGTRSVTPLGRA